MNVIEFTMSVFVTATLNTYLELYHISKNPEYRYLFYSLNLGPVGLHCHFEEIKLRVIMCYNL